MSADAPLPFDGLRRLAWGAAWLGLRLAVGPVARLHRAIGRLHGGIVVRARACHDKARGARQERTVS